MSAATAALDESGHRPHSQRSRRTLREQGGARLPRAAPEADQHAFWSTIPPYICWNREALEHPGAGHNGIPLQNPPLALQKRLEDLRLKARHAAPKQDPVF